MEGFFSWESCFAENSLKAAVITSASRPLKNTRYRGGCVLLSFFRAKSMPYFLAVAENARMLSLVISRLETPVLCFISSFRVCFPLGSWWLLFFCASRNFRMALARTESVILEVVMASAIVFWVTSSCMGYLLSPPPYGSWFTREV